MTKTSTEISKTPAQPAPWPGLWGSFRNEIDSLFHRFDNGFGAPAMRSLIDIGPFWGRTADTIFPAIDVVEDDQAYILSAELPGLDDKSVTVSVVGDMLVIKGEKSEETEEKDKSRYLSERSYGCFERSFRLPDSVDQDGIAAQFAKGVLKITLPKTKSAAASKQIEVKSA